MSTTHERRGAEPSRQRPTGEDRLQSEDRPGTSPRTTRPSTQTGATHTTFVRHGVVSEPSQQRVVHGISCRKWEDTDARIRLERWTVKGFGEDVLFVQVGSDREWRQALRVLSGTRFGSDRPGTPERRHREVGFVRQLVRLLEWTLSPQELQLLASVEAFGV
jgi:hypothetical protein